jgi:hypothetical protein
MSCSNIRRCVTLPARQERQTDQKDGEIYMKKYVFFLIMWFLPITIMGAEGPKLEVVDHDIDFGQVFQGEHFEHVFRFRNAGDEPLVIRRVRTSCGCTAALLSADTIAPGEDGEISSTFDSTGFSGAVVKTVYLYTNDPRQAVAQLHLRGTVKEALALAPARLDFGTIPSGRVAQETIALTNHGNREITISGVDASLAEVQVALSGRRLLPGETMELTVTVVPTEGKHRINGYIFVRTDNPRTRDLRIPVFATIGTASH